MLKTEDAIVLNQYGQGLISNEILLSMFSDFASLEKRDYLREIISLISQSKPKEEDIEIAIAASKLKSTFTPCVLLRKGIANHSLQKIADLPDTELNKVLILFLELFKVAYKRRFDLEKNDPNKWWYWDLSDQANLKRVSDLT